MQLPDHPPGSVGLHCLCAAGLLSSASLPDASMCKRLALLVLREVTVGVHGNHALEAALGGVDSGQNCTRDPEFRLLTGCWGKLQKAGRLECQQLTTIQVNSSCFPW